MFRSAAALRNPQSQIRFTSQILKHAVSKGRVD
jgi:hypothetical protein